jgi:aryl-alcohol dehydrogenase-like predicted oxidoreductase
VQNLYNLTNRRSEAVLAYCEQQGIGFIPWYPLAAGHLAQPGSILDGIAKARNATPSQIALAWVLQRSPVMLPIPGTSKVAHLEENVAAAGISLSPEDFAALDRAGNSPA